MWSTIQTLWRMPFGHVLDVTVLLDNWKIALSFAVFGRTLKPAQLVNLSVKFTPGSAGTEGWGSIAGVSEWPFSSRCMQHPYVLRRTLRYVVPSPWVPTASALPQQVPADAPVWWGGRRDVLPYAPCVYPAAKALQPFLRTLPWSVWQTSLVSLGIWCP